MTRQMILAAAAATTLVGLIGGCASSDEAPFDPRGMSAAQREAAKGLAPGAVVGLPDKLDSIADSDITPKNKYQNEPLLNRLDNRPRVVRVDLREAIQRAVANNLDVRVASYQPAIEESRVTEADARFDPVVFLNPTAERNRGISPSANGSFIESDFTRLGIETGWRQVNELGGEYTLQYTAQHVDSHAGADATTFSSGGNNEFFNELKFQLTQPLLRDFGSDVNNARIVINRNNQHVALLDFREQLEKSLTDLERTYWQLVQARREVEIQQDLLQNTINTANTLFLRKDQDVNRLQISQANASIETRRAQLVRAQARVDDLSDNLKQLMSDPSLPLAGPDLVLPATPPALQQVVVDPQEQIETALMNRTELGQQQLRIDSAMVALRVAKNNKLPRFDFVGSLTTQGRDETYSDAFEEQFGFHSGWAGAMSAGVQFEYPLGNRAANAIFRRAQLQMLQANDSYRQLIEKVILDVKAATREVNTTWNETVRTKQAVYAAADALRAVQVREDAGEALTPEFVDLKLRQQELLASSERDEAAAISNYNISLAGLERVKGTLLKYNNVMLEEASLPRGS